MNGNHVAQWLEGLTEKNTVILKNECIYPKTTEKFSVIVLIQPHFWWFE
jgi:hypothetical protein